MSEQHLEIEKLVEDAINSIEIIEIVNGTVL